MEFITNAFLQKITPPKFRLLKYRSSPNEASLDIKMYINAGNYFRELLINNSYFKRLYEESNEDAQGSLKVFAKRVFYIKEAQKIEQQLNNQLSLCKELHQTGIGYRNEVLLDEINQEIFKLELVLKVGFTSLIVYFTDELFKEIYPLKKTKKSRAQDVSTLLFKLKIGRGDKEFLIKESAKDYVAMKKKRDKSYEQDWEDAIYEIIKYELSKFDQTIL